MRPIYHGIKYYSSADKTLGSAFEKAKALLDSFDSSVAYNDINRVIELYNVQQVVYSEGIKAEFSTPYKDKAKKLGSIIARFFKALDDSSFSAQYNSVCFPYLDDFWSLVEKYKLYETTSFSIIQGLLSESFITLGYILSHKNTVKHYSECLARYMSGENQCAEIIMDKFLRLSEGKQCYLPEALKPQEYEAIIQSYIDSDFPNLNYLQLLEKSQSSAECPISDLLRLNAKHKRETLWEKRTGGSVGMSFGVSVSLGREPDIVSYRALSDHEYNFRYDTDWIRENLDYPTLLNNYIYLFSYVDLHYRCKFTSTRSKMTTLERALGIKGVKEYPFGIGFKLDQMKSSAEMVQYQWYLSQYGIHIEDLIGWFFSTYLKDVFGVDGFVVNMPSQGCSLLEKCKLMPTEIDGALKQYQLYTEHEKIDRELFEMSSNQVFIKDIPSMIINKYAYSNSEGIENELSLLFSDQSSLAYIERYSDKNHNFALLLFNHPISQSDYPEWAQPNLQFLCSKGTIRIDPDGRVIPNYPKIKLLRSLYENEVLCAAYYANNEIFNKMIAEGDLRYESTLFSIPEQQYLNYILNKSEFSNGLDLRNKYIHSTYTTNPSLQQHDYIQLLKIFILVVLKINEEFCLKYPEPQ